MKTRRYVQRYDGEPFSVASGETHRISCCDCGLVHDMLFVSTDGEPISVTANRNNRATAQRRKKLGAGKLFATRHRRKTRAEI